MTAPVTRPLEVRLTLTLGTSLLVFSVLAGIFTYIYAYRYQLELAGQLQLQLMRTVQAQAEVAAFAANEKIASGVLNGLTANDNILAARIETPGGFKVELGSRKNVDFSTGRTYPLFSPVDYIEHIGTLTIVQNDAEVNATAQRAAIFQILLMLAQLLVTAIFLTIVLRRMLIKPITRLAAAMVSIAPGSASRVRVDKNHLDDEIGLLSNSANTILDAAEKALAEVTAQRNELERTATHDYLTGLPTMRLAEDRLQIACNNARRSNEKIALLFIDLDNFKAINDTYGHDMGDVVLCEAATRLQGNVRAGDTAARIGGDEFMAILVGLADEQTALLTARNLCAILSRPYTFGEHTLLLGASIGVALFPDHTGDVKAMRHIADLAMYKVKQSGKGNVALAEAEPAEDNT